MKKLLALLFAACMTIAVCSCGKEPAQASSGAETAVSASEEEPEETEAEEEPEETEAEEEPADTESAVPSDPLVFKWNEPQTVLWGIVALEFIDDPSLSLGSRYAFMAGAKYADPESLLVILESDLKEQGFDSLARMIKRTMEYGEKVNYDDGIDVYTWDRGSFGVPLTAIIRHNDNGISGVVLCTDDGEELISWLDGKAIVE